MKRRARPKPHYLFGELHVCLISIFNWYQKLIDLRHTEKVVSKGKVFWPEDDHESLLIYGRTLNDETWLVYNNLEDKEVSISFETLPQAIILSNYNRKELKLSMTLNPYESLVVKL